MPHRNYLFSLRIAHALRESCIKEPYTPRRLAKDVGAGITVGIIAIPLAVPWPSPVVWRPSMASTPP